MTATTALTAQNTQGVYGIHETPPEFVRKQIDACIDDIGVDVVKTATSGARLLPEEAIKILCDHLLPVTTILTPNIPEARLILEKSGHDLHDIKDLEDIKQLARSVQKLGPKYVLIKGGHLPLTKGYHVPTGDEARELVINVLYGDGEFTVIDARLDNATSSPKRMSLCRGRYQNKR
ncbi:hypothetical protein LTR28_008830 [Elasticomyces elasticus]|nr:hypothetical protein LTR28_008830 [Elasticomyces elasticus]